MKQLFARIHVVLSAFIGIAVWGQMLLAGLWHSGTVATPEAHVILGLTVLLASLVVLVAALAGRLGPRAVKLSALLFVLMLLQPIFMSQRHGALAILSSLHTLNAAFIGMTSGVVIKVGRDAAAEVRDSAEATPAVATD